MVNNSSNNSAKKKAAASGKKKKTAAKSAAAKKTAAKAKTSKKGKSVKKAASTVKGKKTAKSRRKKTAVLKKKPVSIKNLILKKFDRVQKEELFTVKPEEKSKAEYKAPPFVPEKDKEKAKKIKELLFIKFDLAAISRQEKSEVRAGEEAPAEEKEKEVKAGEEEKAYEVIEKTFELEETTSKAECISKGIITDWIKKITEKTPLLGFKKQVQAPELTLTEILSTDTEGFGFMEKNIKYLVAAIAIVLMIIIGSSFSNMCKYYIKPYDGGIEIWQGRFSPIGTRHLISLPVVSHPEKIKKVYSKTDVLPLVFNFYLDKADSLLDEPGMPDFEKIKEYLKEAKPFAVTKDLRKIVRDRLNSIEMINLVYRADVAASKKTVSGYEEALKYLNEASLLKLDEAKAEQVKQKIASITELKTALETPMEEVQEGEKLKESSAEQSHN